MADNQNDAPQPVLATLQLPGRRGSLVLRPAPPNNPEGREWSWTGDRPALAPLARLADDYSNPPEYVYGPADGAPGRVAAQRVQGLLGGALRYEPLPKTAPAPEGEERAY